MILLYGPRPPLLRPGPRPPARCAARRETGSPVPAQAVAGRGTPLPLSCGEASHGEDDLPEDVALVHGRESLPCLG
ncbi:hypothetical protein GCM10010156_58460 [Planobispora rosea]|uniref:Uncharacterized protein n=1 Tax=Planobispora rosea TaxID=35762 RepID=A0A8J3S5G8_PLARO|nr:hypothetical protein GCM10010156_58460 [Planobispora rosea]GIH87149.1 hypothetical protein Pro02_55570 [Planobispora rosea]